MNLNAAKRVANKIRLEKGRPNWPTPVKYIGGGVDGKVYLTDNGKLMKITFDADPQEFRGLAKLQNTGFVPQFNKRNWVIMGKSKKGTKMTAFLMGKIGGPDDQVMTLHEYTKKGGAYINWRSAVSRMIRIMHVRGVSHGNLHEQNVLVVITPSGKVKLYIIDFGRSMFFPVGMTEREMYAPMKPGGFHHGAPLFLNKKGIPHRANVHIAKLTYDPINRSNENRIRMARRLVNTKKLVKSPNVKVVKNLNNSLVINAPNRAPMFVNVRNMKLKSSGGKILANLKKLTNVIPKTKKIN